MKKYNGFTILESLIAVSILSLSFILYMNFKSIEIKDELMDQFEYDFRKVMDSMSKKINDDQLVSKVYWSDYSFDGNLNNHLIINLTDKISNCENISILDFNGKNYIKCFPPIRMSVFNVKVDGSIIFNSSDDFKYYSINFTPKNNESLKDLNYLYKRLKSIMRDSSFYSNIDFFANNKNVSFSECSVNNTSCILKMDFGTEFNYHEKDSEIYTTTNNKKESFEFLSNSSDNIFKNNKDKDNDYINDEIKVKSIDVKNAESYLRESLNENGIKLTDRDFNKLKAEIKRSAKNPEFIKQAEEQLNSICSGYDDDDYYFMSKYDKNNLCYKNYIAK